MAEGGGRFAVNPSEIAAKVVEGEAVMINLATGVYYSLPGTGASAWELLAAGADVETAARHLARAYGVDEGAVTRDVSTLVETLLREGLLVEAPETPSPAELPSVAADGAYEAPALDKYTDLGDLLALDPPMPGLADIPWTSPQA